MVSLAIQRGFAALFAAFGPLFMIYPESGIRMMVSDKTLQVDEVHVLLMSLIGIAFLMLGVLMYFAKFDVGTWRAFGAILVVGAMVDMYTYINIPTVARWVPVTDMCGCFVCYGLVLAAIKESAAKDNKSA
mmetsp:Transcript_10218/g.29258  ORF Transcript_10218/g.29258 Transcript_10218/m.29258 type:complete len:131 (-) Transcript_10218:279-671(-)|eukprot:CAMPEP_0117668148 /NCGR_PEP_ID=MMETSP0804-20121206/11373_1 /TAXON_ID=1074897 /ORGANISM="Tetraselmis astigmatica, Strain CCMP880" /LENGTH=130 /DNA_ID=CAMNT_0005475977 /DNA_START=104 /DNA_END=496 /DNA_ORIENTATION=+